MKAMETVVFTEKDMQKVPAPHMNLEGIVEEFAFIPKTNEPYMLVKCKPFGRHKSGCPHCGSVHINVHGKSEAPRLIHDIKIGDTQFDLLLETPRYRCLDCGRTFNHRFDCIQENLQMTDRLIRVIGREAFKYPFSDLAMKYGISAPKVATIFDEYVASIRDTLPPVVAPRVLGIDEKHIVHDMRGVFVDIQTGQLLEMTSNNKREVIIDTICSMIDYDKNIEVVTMDMANNYRACVQMCLPNAKIIVDKFHLFQGLYTRISKTRSILTGTIKKQIEAETDPVRKLNMEHAKSLLDIYKYLFKFGQAKLAEDEERLKALYDVCKTFKEFNHLRLIKECFEKIYESESKAEAQARYEGWEKLVPPRGSKKAAAWGEEYGLDPSLFLEFQSFRNSIRSWYNEVFAYFEDGCRFTNAAAEGLNCMIERINRVGNGYSFERLRAKALYKHLAEEPKKYVFQRERKPIYDDDDDISVSFSKLDLFNLSSGFSSRRIKGYTTFYSVVEEQGDIRKQKPLSVFSYVPSASPLQA